MDFPLALSCVWKLYSNVKRNMLSSGLRPLFSLLVYKDDSLRCKYILWGMYALGDHMPPVCITQFHFKVYPPVVLVTSEPCAPCHLSFFVLWNSFRPCFLHYCLQVLQIKCHMQSYFIRSRDRIRKHSMGWQDHLFLFLSFFFIVIICR